jgi:hypothetical protein
MKSVVIAFCVFFMLIIPGRQSYAQCCQFTWQQQVEPATSAATFGVALGDFDNDGDVDAVSISAYYGVDVYFNNGSGTFTLGAQYATGSNGNFYGVHVLDVDNDNDLDIIAVPFYSSTPMAILKNNGAGIFSVSTVSTNIATYNAAVGDLDGDNDIDIFLPNSGGGSGKIFKNNGMGTYTLYQTLTGARGHAVALGDLDNDGDQDAFVVENSSYGYSVYMNDSTGMFTQLGTTFGTNGSFVALGDLDKDGDLDAWVGKSNNTSEIWLNNGSGVFSLYNTITNGSYCKSVVLYDFDNDGFQDVFMAFYSAAPQVWKNHGDLTFTLCYQAPVGSSSHGQAVGFLDGDSYIDIYTGHFSNTDGDYVFLNSSPLISYAGSPFCPNDPAPQQINLTGTPGGVYTSNPYGLSLDSVTGTFIPSSSLAGNYFVYYTQSGCSVKTGLEIIGLDPGTTLNDTIITAIQDSALYQWVDCNNGYQHIAGAIGQSYAASVSGDYAVIITYRGCTDTSACVNISITTSLPEHLTENRPVRVYPNPIDNMLVIETGPHTEGIPYALYDYSGRSVMKGWLTSEIQSLETGHLPAGIYLLRVGLGSGGAFKVVKE